jgi:FtsZ-binding cell division protein ZapB
MCEPTCTDIIPRLIDLEKWYGFIQTTDQMIESNQIISGAAAEIQELRERNQKLTNELAKWESGEVFSQHAAQLYEQQRARIAELETEGR